MTFSEILRRNGLSRASIKNLQHFLHFIDNRDIYERVICHDIMGFVLVETEYKSNYDLLCELIRCMEQYGLSAYDATKDLNDVTFRDIYIVALNEYRKYQKVIRLIKDQHFSTLDQVKNFIATQLIDKYDIFWYRILEEKGLYAKS